MNIKSGLIVIASWVVLSPGGAAAQAYPPGTLPNLDRRVFVDVSQVTPSKVLDQLADAIACRLDVDRKLPQSAISLRLSNVRARTALDAVCDVVGCRWNLKGSTLVVTATAPPPAAPQGQQWLDKVRVPLTGAQWKLDHIPLRDVLARLSEQIGADVVFEGPDQSAPITDDLRGRTAIDAFQRIPWALGYNMSGMFMRLPPGRDRQEIRLEGRKESVYGKGEPGLAMPSVVNMVRPHYPREAMNSKKEGVVTVSCVVGVDGSVSDVTVTQGLDPVLDAEAVAAAKQWRFLPGTKDGKPVPVSITLELTFTIM